LLSAVVFLISGLLLLTAALLESNSGLKGAGDVFAWPGIVLVVPAILACLDSGVMHD
jgi:hydrogenase-4 membrane subunit HyfE